MVTTTVDLRILGPVEVVNGERRVSIECRRTRVLLAMLLVWRNQTVSLDALISSAISIRPGPSRSTSPGSPGSEPSSPPCKG